MISSGLKFLSVLLVLGVVFVFIKTGLHLMQQKSAKSYPEFAKPQAFLHWDKNTYIVPQENLMVPPHSGLQDVLQKSGQYDLWQSVKTKQTIESCYLGLFYLKYASPEKALFTAARRLPPSHLEMFAKRLGLPLSILPQDHAAWGLNAQSSAQPNCAHWMRFSKAPPPRKTPPPQRISFTLKQGKCRPFFTTQAVEVTVYTPEMADLSFDMALGRTLICAKKPGYIHMQVVPTWDDPPFEAWGEVIASTSAKNTTVKPAAPQHRIRPKTLPGWEH